mmetsp:Transcript_20453/g.44303  ORF Transcript_20453/g.44303 Transcript_20453/m.44303 type:complete len:81 (+) Transcript_20453:241-483(+)
MSIDLATQVSALVGTSLILFLAMKPRSSSSHSGGHCHEHNDDTVPLEDPTGLKGIKRYSSYHRKRHYRHQRSSAASVTSQ